MSKGPDVDGKKLAALKQALGKAHEELEQAAR